MQHDYSLFESFTKHGVWWLPSNPADRVRGDLVYDQDHIELKLYGAFDGTSSVLVDRQVDVILGCCGSELVTLIKCDLGERWDIMTDSVTSTWWCQFAVIGLQAADALEHRYDYAEIRFTGLEHWISDKPIEDRFPADPNDPLRTIRIEHHHESPRDFDVPAIETNIGLTATCNQRGAGYKISLEHRASVRIRPSEPKSLHWFIKTQHQFQRMLSFFADTSVQTVTLRLFSKGASEFDPLSGCLIWPAIQQKDNSERLARGMLIRFPDIASRFAEVLNIWFANAERLKHVYDLFFAGSQHQTVYLEQDFLQLAQALEVYSRVAQESKYVADVEYKRIADTLIAAIPHDADKDLRQSLKARIRFGNEYSLRKRITTILRELESETVKLITDDAKAFVGRVVDTRNFLVHLDDTTAENVISGTDLFPAINKMRLLLMVLFMRELQFSEPETREILRRSSVFREGES